MQMAPDTVLRATAAGEDPARPIRIEVAERLPAMLADPDRIHQVLLNLLSNARKYSPAGGEVRLSACSAGDTAEDALLFVKRVRVADLPGADERPHGPGSA